MGAAASATRNVLVEKLPKCTDYEKAFEHLHQHNIQGDGIDFDTFKEGIKELGFEIKDDDVMDYFHRENTRTGDESTQCPGTTQSSSPRWRLGAREYLGELRPRHGIHTEPHTLSGATLL